MKNRMLMLAVITASLSVGLRAQQTVTTSGGTGSYVAKFTGTTTVGNSAIYESNGNVGIGTTAPAEMLELGSGGYVGTRIFPSDDTTPGLTGYALRSRETGGYTRTWRIFTAPVGGGFGVPINSFSVWDYPGNYGTGNCCNQRFTILPSANGAPAPSSVVIDPNGNLGVGTFSPRQKLEVAGSILLSSGSGGSITYPDGTTQSTAWTGSLCGGDYAESVDVTGGRSHYGPGDVLRIDDDHRGAFLKEAEPYSTAVAGVFSTRPGALGRRQTTPKSPDEVPLAMIGIVPVKVTTENGPIRPHDLLVSSSRPGYAMKGTDRSRMLGAVIGKAMEPLDKGDGVIEVLLTLQ